MGFTSEGKWCYVCKKQCKWGHFVEKISKNGNIFLICADNFIKNNNKSKSRKGKFQPRTKSLKYDLYSLEYKRDRYLEKQYGISLDDFNFKLEEQNFCCAICNRHQSEFKKNLNVDHCHTTGKIRGLLCGKCNKGLGQLFDNISNINNAIQYLKDND